jgi:hypothetical protein
MFDLRDTVGGSVGLPLFCEDYLKDNRTPATILSRQTSAQKITVGWPRLDHGSMAG